MKIEFAICADSCSDGVLTSSNTTVGSDAILLFVSSTDMRLTSLAVLDQKTPSTAAAAIKDNKIMPFFFLLVRSHVCTIRQSTARVVGTLSTDNRISRADPGARA